MLQFHGFLTAVSLKSERSENILKKIKDLRPTLEAFQEASNEDFDNKSVERLWWRKIYPQHMAMYGKKRQQNSRFVVV